MLAARNTILLVAICLVLAACATQPIPDAYDPPGFFMGLVHGAVAPLALIGSFFLEIRVYAFPNSGLGYDFGYVIGILFVWCSIAAAG